jgi:acetyl esterase/lipase
VWAFLGTNYVAKAAFAVAALPLGAVGVAMFVLSGRFLPALNMTTPYWGALVDGASALQHEAATRSTEGADGSGTNEGGAEGDLDVGCSRPEQADAKLCPHLLLYSADDPVVPAFRVRAFADTLTTAGVAVDSKEWGRSEHVAHYRHHPAEYTDLLKKFLA